MSAFYELAVLHELSRRELRALDNDDPVSLGDGKTDFVQTVKSWALPSVELNYCANVDLGHAYKWYGSRPPSTVQDLRSAIHHYRAAFSAQAQDIVAATLQALSRAETELE
jgi:hypothetical protein